MTDAAPASTAVQVLVTGDTHLRDGARLPIDLLALAERADVILHTGDVVAGDVLDVLRAFAPVTAVLGNNDDEFVGRLPEREVVELAGVRIGMVHDGGVAQGRAARLRAWFPDARVVLYGHSHLPELSDDDGLLVLNPGSPTQRRRARSHTAAWLELRDGDVTAAHLVEVDR
ncbi:MAG: metallophosphoesterase family protein [Thermoleophilia bacterium]|nr:metallophosphoesterase family protein [Thermoleophilia bacterium]